MAVRHLHCSGNRGHDTPLEDSVMASSSRKTRRRRQVPRSWTTVGALVASATFAPRVAAAEPTRINPAASAIIRQVEQSIGPWERPEDVLAAAVAHPSSEAEALNKSVQDPPSFISRFRPGRSASHCACSSRPPGLTVRVAPELVRDLTSPGARGMLTAGQRASTDSLRQPADPPPHGHGHRGRRGSAGL